MDHIALGQGVIFSFQSKFTGNFATLLAHELSVVCVTYNLSTYKTTFKITVNHPRRIGCLGSHFYRPSPDLFRVCGKKCLQSEKLVTGINQSV